MSLVFALSPAWAYDIAAVAVWFVIFPAFVTALIGFAIAGTLRERVENERSAGEARAQPQLGRDSPWRTPTPASPCP